MKTVMRTGLVRSIGVFAALMVTLSTLAFSDFTIVRVRGRVKVKIPTAKEFTAAKSGQKCPFGTAIKTGRLSSAMIELSEGNRFRVLGSTTITVTPNAANPKLVRVKIEQGRLAVSLKKFPKDAKFEVESPVGVCAAVGTDFTFSYQMPSGEVRLVSIAVSAGAVTFTGELFGAAEVAAGGSLEAALYESAAGWYLRIRVTGTPVDLKFGNNVVHLNAGTTAAFAFGRTAAGTPDMTQVASRILRGSGVIGGRTVNSDTGAFLIRDNSVTVGAGADQMLNQTAPPATRGEMLVPQPAQDVPQSPGGVQ